LIKILLIIFFWRRYWY